eukprot:CAMPEP_0113676418 /NCGR_PEP_ID=MMETSP0038_2-20120614/8632_1 /TAXON_ID=2898 /ORGANISM="Cryptomonas paramecium" /LENGTH=103 /DNA_ID=CAMNT_0000593445 /DNA_START=213 /DNA_END=524 /DNA_ORIENTATION=+ /assembly_acc=CAM_ASM_000170
MPTPLPGSPASESICPAAWLAKTVTNRQGSDNRGPLRRLPQAVFLGDSVVSGPPGAKGSLPSAPLNRRWRRGGAGGGGFPGRSFTATTPQDPLLSVATPGRLE